MKRTNLGFTLVEIMVAVSVVGFLLSIIILGLRLIKEKNNITQAVASADVFIKAVELYNDQMGFYPPEVNRGFDPGLLQPLPWNPEDGRTVNHSCAHCPSDWQTIVQEKWDGPYLGRWPSFTPWGGKYDYNYWASGATRYGCPVPPGVYIGIQRDRNDQNPITVTAEQEMVNKGLDFDDCINGEAQVILFLL